MNTPPPAIGPVQFPIPLWDIAEIVIAGMVILVAFEVLVLAGRFALTRGRR